MFQGLYFYLTHLFINIKSIIVKLISWNLFSQDHRPLHSTSKVQPVAMSGHKASLKRLMEVLKHHNLDIPIVEANEQLLLEFENRVKNQYYLVQHFHELSGDDRQAPDLLQQTPAHKRTKNVCSTSAVEDIFSRSNATYTSHRFCNYWIQRIIFLDWGRVICFSRQDN